MFYTKTITKYINIINQSEYIYYILGSIALLASLFNFIIKKRSNKKNRLAIQFRGIVQEITDRKDGNFLSIVNYFGSGIFPFLHHRILCDTCENLKNSMNFSCKNTDIKTAIINLIATLTEMINYIENDHFYTLAEQGHIFKRKRSYEIKSDDDGWKHYAADNFKYIDNFFIYEISSLTSLIITLYNNSVNLKDTVSFFNPIQEEGELLKKASLKRKPLYKRYYNYRKKISKFNELPFKITKRYEIELEKIIKEIEFK